VVYRTGASPDAPDAPAPAVLRPVDRGGGA
jgi:hypothetical protein